MGNLQALLELTDSLDEHELINSSMAIHIAKTQYGIREEAGTFVTDISNLDINVPVIKGYSIDGIGSEELGAVLVVKALKSNELGVKIKENYDYIVIFNEIAYCRLLSELQFIGYKAKNISINATGKIVHTLIIDGRKFILSGIHPELKLKEIK